MACSGKHQISVSSISASHFIFPATSSVNFKKMMPKAGVFKQSEVFQVLNEEQLKTKAEQEREDKYNWTTFLQKPQRPPPTRSTQPVLINTYKPQIVKQPKPKCAPDYRAPTPVRIFVVDWRKFDLLTHFRNSLKF